MAYSKTTWVDRDVQYPTRYLVDGASKTITPDAGTVTNAGTAFSAARMNTIETKLSEVADGTNYYIVCGGTANALTATVTGITAYTAGMVLNIKSTAINTGNTTININSLGAKTIARINSSGAINDILPGSLLYGTIIYNGTYFLLLTDHTAHDDRALIDSTGSMLYASSAYTPAKLAIGTAGKCLVSRGGVPAWERPNPYIYTPSNTQQLFKTTEVSVTSASYVTVASFKLNYRGKFRVICDMKRSSSDTIYARVVQTQYNTSWVAETVVLTSSDMAVGSTTYVGAFADTAYYHVPYVMDGRYGEPQWIFVQAKVAAGSGAAIKNIQICYDVTEQIEAIS